MNLYDKDDGFKCFNVKQANALLPQIIAATDAVIDELETLKQRLEADQVIDPAFAEDQYEDETTTILQKWSQRMIELGVYPKGYFTVDFKSAVPDTLLCWTYGEKEVCHTHKIYETFKDRVAIENRELPGFENSLN